MKDIKSFLIGFLSCTCIFLFMGQTTDNTWNKSFNVENELNVGKYQWDFEIDPVDLSHKYYIFDTFKGVPIEFGVVDANGNQKGIKPLFNE